jgi:hypothetical protein
VGGGARALRGPPGDAQRHRQEDEEERDRH